jgi:hypothetical protein
MEVAATRRSGDSTILARGYGLGISLTPDERATLKRGEPLASDHPLSKRLADDPRDLVLRPPQDRGDDARHEALVAEHEALVADITAAYPNARVRSGRGSPGTAEKLDLLAKRPVTLAQTVAIVADQTLGVKDAKVLQNLRPEIEPKLSVVTARRGEPFVLNRRIQTVILITGHQDGELVGFVQELAKGHAFENTLVILQSCSGRYSTAATEAILKGGALAVARPFGEIRAVDVEKFVLSLANVPSSQLSEADLLRLMREADMHALIHTTAIWRIRRTVYA